MLPLATTFTHRSFTYTQLARTATVALYEQRHHTAAAGAVTYEVIRIQQHPAHTWPDGTTSPAREGYPPASQWGRWGWTERTLAAAQHRYATMRAGQDAHAC